MKYSSPFPIFLCAALGFVLSFSLFVPPVFSAEATAGAEEAAATEPAESADDAEEPAVTEKAGEAEDAEEPAAAEKADDAEEPAVTEKAGEADDAEEPAAAEKAGETDAASAGENPADSKSESEKELSILDLIKSGGVLMIPIGIMSVLVVMVGLERFFGLCSWVVLPRWLMHNVDVQVSAKADPRAIYALCRRNHSALSNVIQAALFKAGRPMPEVQNAIEQAKENEANRLYSRVRLLALAASVTPLIGLLGTVVGMIQAFMATASTVGIHKAEMLSEGIYLALITTCAGLAVAIPAAILAHWYEGKIQRLFYRMDQKLINFVAYLEVMEGKVHLTPAAYKAYVKQKSGKK